MRDPSIPTMTPTAPRNMSSTSTPSRRRLAGAPTARSTWRWTSSATNMYVGLSVESR